MSDNLTADDLRKMLREKYVGNGYKYALFDEVHNATGYDGNRSCDVLGMSLWPSEGLEIEGFEIKVTRADFLNELRDPDKAETFKKHCDRWWLVAASKSVVKNDLPTGWGMMWARAGKLVVSVGAPKLDPEPLPRPMLAALLRRAVEGYADKNAAEERYRAGVKQGEESRKWEMDRIKKSLDELRETVKAFEESSGIKLHRWNDDAGEIGAAVDAVLKMGGRFGAIGSLANCATALARDAGELRKHLQSLVEAAEAAGIQGELPEID